LPTFTAAGETKLGTCTAKVEESTEGAAGADDYVRLAKGQTCNSKTPKTGCAEGLRCTSSGGGMLDAVKEMGVLSNETCGDEILCGESMMGMTWTCNAITVTATVGSAIAIINLM
jgi:hypothetical protein